MPGGKAAGQRCVQLSDDNLCLIFGHPSRPAVCGNLTASSSMCGGERDYALAWLTRLEAETAPDRAFESHG